MQLENLFAQIVAGIDSDFKTKMTESMWQLKFDGRCKTIPILYGKYQIYFEKINRNIPFVDSETMRKLSLEGTIGIQVNEGKGLSISKTSEHEGERSRKE